MAPGFNDYPDITIIFACLNYIVIKGVYLGTVATIYLGSLCGWRKRERKVGLRKVPGAFSKSRD